MLLRAAILIVMFTVARAMNHAQQSTDDLFPCESPATYEDLNEKNPKRLRVSHVQGLAVIYAIQSESNVVIKGACVALFAEGDHRLVAQTVSSEADGSFAFQAIPSGRYRLVIRHHLGFMNVANVPLTVAQPKTDETRSGKTRNIVVYMVGSNFAKASFAKLK